MRTKNLKKEMWKECLKRGIAPRPGKEVVKIRYARKPWLYNTYFAGSELPKRVYDYFWMEKFPIKDEYRVLIVRDDITVGYVFKKKHTENVIDEDRRKYKYGWRFVQIRKPSSVIRRDVMEKVMEVIEEFQWYFKDTKFLGVDYAIGTDGRHVIFEINRAPGVSEERKERINRELENIKNLLREGRSINEIEEDFRILLINLNGR